jgi:hypothetical protein
VQPGKRVDESKLRNACWVMLLNLVGLAFPFMLGSIHLSLTTDKLLRIDETMPTHVERLGNLLSVILCNEVHFFLMGTARQDVRAAGREMGWMRAEQTQSEDMCKGSRGFLLAP